MPQPPGPPLLPVPYCNHPSDAGAGDFYTAQAHSALHTDRKHCPSQPLLHPWFGAAPCCVDHGKAGLLFTARPQRPRGTEPCTPAPEIRTTAPAEVPSRFRSTTELWPEGLAPTAPTSNLYKGKDRSVWRSCSGGVSNTTNISDRSWQEKTIPGIDCRGNFYLCVGTNIMSHLIKNVLIIIGLAQQKHYDPSIFYSCRLYILSSKKGLFPFDTVDFSTKYRKGQL